MVKLLAKFALLILVVVVVYKLIKLFYKLFIGLPWKLCWNTVVVSGKLCGMLVLGLYKCGVRLLVWSVAGARTLCSRGVHQLASKNFREIP